MNARKTGRRAKLAMLLGVLLTACLLAVTAKADTLYKGKFTLTNEVRWGKAVLPAGNYVLKIDGTAQLITVEDAEKGVTLVREFVHVGNGDPNGDGALRVAVRGHQRTVYSVELGGMGEVFHTKGGPTRAEKEAAEGNNLQDIPITVAEKSDK
jgi:hypothetical protein